MNVAVPALPVVWNNEIFISHNERLLDIVEMEDISSFVMRIVIADEP